MDKEKKNEMDNLIDDIRAADTKNKEKISRLLELALELAGDRTRSTLTIEQIDLPDDWNRQLLDAKADHDKHGAITLTLVLPLSWLESFKEKVNNGELDSYYNKARHYLWGANVVFGPVDRPVAAGTW